MRRHFTEKDTQKPNTHMKSCPVSLAVREMQVKTTVRSPYVPFRIATMKNNTETSVDAEKLDHSCIAGTATLEKRLALSFKIKNGVAERHNSCTLRHIIPERWKLVTKHVKLRG